MTTIAKDIAAKLAVAVVAVAMAFAAFAPAAQAQTTEELQAMINDLLAQVAALQGGSAPVVSASSVCPFTWTRDLSQGSTGADVMKLQQFLNSDADTRVAASGAGSLGAETDYYGPATAAAVSKMQVKYRSQVLAPAGLVNPTGYFGPSSRAAANGLCVAAPVDNGGDDMDGGDDMGGSDDDSSDDNQSLSGEADLEDFEIDDADDTDVEEGQEDVAIGELTVRFENGDAELSRIEFQLLAQGESNTDTVEPWDVFETISLWIDGDMIAEEAVDDEDDWLDEDLGTFRMSGLDIFAGEDEDVDITVAASIGDGLETSPAEIGGWELGVLEIRFFDADGVSDDDASTDDIGGSVTADFDIQEEGDEDELFVRSSSNDPDSTTIELEDDESSDWTTIFIFDLDTEDSTNDIQMEGLTVQVAGTEDGTTATSTANLIDDARLVVDGEEYDDVTITHGVYGNFAFDLDDEDFFIDAGDRVSVEFQVEFEALATSREGATVQASTTASIGLSAEGADDLTVASNQLNGSATGEEHTLRTEGAILETVSTDEEEILNDDTDATDDEGQFTIKFDVTAFESDLFVNKSAASGTAMGTAGVSYIIEDSNGAEVVLGAFSGSLTSTADTDGTRFRVNEGETEEFTLTVVFDPVTTGFYQLQLYSLNFNTSNDNPDTAQRALDASDYETDALNI